MSFRRSRRRSMRRRRAAAERGAPEALVGGDARELREPWRACLLDAGLRGHGLRMRLPEGRLVLLRELLGVGEPEHTTGRGRLGRRRGRGHDGRRRSRRGRGHLQEKGHGKRHGQSLRSGQLACQRFRSRVWPVTRHVRLRDLFWDRTLCLRSVRPERAKSRVIPAFAAGNHSCSERYDRSAAPCIASFAIGSSRSSFSAS